MLHEHPTKNDFVRTYLRFLMHVEWTLGPSGINRIFNIF